MKKHLIIWIPGVLGVIAYALAPQFGDATVLYVIWILGQLIMSYGVYLLARSKGRSRYWIILPLLTGLLGAIIVYLIPGKRTGETTASAGPPHSEVHS